LTIISTTKTWSSIFG